MSQQLYSLSLDSIKLLCGLIRDLASVSEGIDNLHLADNLTFSNIYIKNLVDKCLQDANAEAEKLVGALTHLTCEETAVQPTLDNSEINVIYLYSADGNPPYQQYLKISDTKLVDLGSTSISLTDYIKAADVAKDYATKTELKAVTDKIGTTTLTTTAQTLTGSIEEVKGIAEQGALLTVTKTQYDQLVAGQTVNIDGKDYTYDSNTYYVVKDDGDTIVTTTTINSSSTDNEIATAKAVNVECKYGRMINNDVIATYGTEISKYPTGKWVIYRNDMAAQFTDLPTKAACRINIYGLLDNNFTPFNTSWQYRMITVTDINGKLYTREFNSGNTAGVFEQDTGWQRVVTTKVDDVPWTTITFSDETNYKAITPCSYSVKNGICYVFVYVKCLTPTTSDSIVYEGLPLPLNGTQYVTIGGIGNTSFVNCIVNGTTGNLIFRGGAANSGCIGNFSYPVADS